MLNLAYSPSQKFGLLKLMLFYALLAASGTALVNNAYADQQGLKRPLQMMSDSMVNQAFFESNSISRLSSQLEYEISNSKMLAQTIHEKEKLLIAEKLRYKKINKIYLSVLGVLILIAILLWFSHRKALKNNLLHLEANCKKEFDRILARENVMVRLETLENERDRISRALHDGISNNLVTIRLHLRSIDDSQPEKAILAGLAENTHREIRAMMHNLSSPNLRNIPFERLFRNHIDMMNYRNEMRVEGILLPENGWSELSEMIQTELYRLLQEITGNIIKHAQASTVTITLRKDVDCIVLLAEDDGIGLPAEQESFGFGLRNLKVRTEQLLGDLQVHSSPIEGTLFRISIPIQYNTYKESILSVNQLIE